MARRLGSPICQKDQAKTHRMSTIKKPVQALEGNHQRLLFRPLPSIATLGKPGSKSAARKTVSDRDDTNYLGSYSLGSSIESDPIGGAHRGRSASEDGDEEGHYRIREWEGQGS